MKGNADCQSRGTNMPGQILKENSGRALKPGRVISLSVVGYEKSPVGKSPMLPGCLVK